MSTLKRLAAILLACLAGPGSLLHAEPAAWATGPVDAAEIEPLLPLEPSAGGAPIADRGPWEHFRDTEGAAIIAEADRLLKKKSPELTDDLYLVFSRKGTRKEYETPYRERLRRLTIFTLAECATDQGTYKDAFLHEFQAVLDEKTWSMPAQDRDLRKFHGTLQDVDLGVAMRGATIATAVSWLGNRLPGELRQQALEELETRMFAPYREKIRNPSSPLCYWATVDHNWNAVCHAGIISAALAILPDRKDRAEMLAGMQKFLPHYLSGFTPDGYCGEGMTYWNYGFGHYALLAETVLRATGGSINLYAPASVRRVAEYPEKMALAPGVYPAFADSPLNTRPADWVRRLCQARLDSVGSQVPLSAPPDLDSILLYGVAVTAFPSPVIPVANQPPGPDLPDPLRGWFPDAGVLIARPAKQAPAQLSVALLGGTNGDNHNHNDIGQFVAQVGGTLPLLDPGMEPYTAQSFGPKRYESEMLNSLGHSVPRIAGKLQRAGKEAVARVLAAEFTPGQDRLVLDISSAYAVPSLTKLERAFTYTRAENASLEVRDDFAFSDPQDFETALITFGTVVHESADTLLVAEGPGRVRVRVSAGDLPFEILETAIDSSRAKDPTRICVRLKAPATRGVITCQITPAPAP